MNRLARRTFCKRLFDYDVVAAMLRDLCCDDITVQNKCELAEDNARLTTLCNSCVNGI